MPTFPISGVKILLSTFGKYRLHLGVLVALGFLGAILEGVGINAAIPLLSFLLDAQSVPLDFISGTIRGVFDAVGIEFTFRFLLVFIVVLFLLRAAALALFGYIRGWIGADFLYHETRDTLHRMLFASWPFLLRQKLGTVQTTLVRDIQRTSNLLMVVSQAIQSFTGFLMYLLVALNISPVMTLWTLAGGGVLLLFVRPLLSRTRAVAEQLTGTEKQISQFISEHLIGMKTLKAAGAEDAAFSSGNIFLRTLRTLQIRIALILSLSGSVFQPFTIIFVIILFAITYQLPGFNLISFAATLYLIQKIFTYLESGQGALHTISELVPYAEDLTRFKRDLGQHAEKDARGGKPFAFARELRFADVTFAYGEREPVLHQINFAVPRGATVALIGPSGSGKTSVADLLLRLFEPKQGRVMLDDVPAQDIARIEWRRRFGYVSQDVFLFNGTIEENIRFYRPELSRAQLIEAAKQANIHEFIESLPEGYGAQVGDRGVMLSGGQRQRIALARALAGKPEILVLDEATSALDSESERLIQEAIRNVRGHTTVFIIAHRLSTVESADTILVLDNGRIVEQGSPEALLKNKDSYFSKHRA